MILYIIASEANNMSIIKVEKISKRFDEIIALDSVELYVEEGEVFCVLGPDGAGKTTLLRILAGVMTPASGALEILGYDIIANIDAAKPQTGYLSQKFSLYPELTVNENIDFYARLFKISRYEGEQRKQRLLEFSRLGAYADRQAKHLSGGMKQKLALSCALIHTPKLLILDEPTTGVDPISRREFWKILYDLIAEGLTIVFATPYMDEAERASRVALLYKGKMIKCDTPDRLRSEFAYDLAELITDDNRRARQLLQDSYGKDNVVFFGDKLHIKLSEFQKEEDNLRILMAKTGIAIVSLEHIAPGMEDVFIDAIS